MNVSEIGNKIKSRRAQLNMTQKDLAKAMNVSNQLISKWETGESVPSLEYFDGLCSVLKVDYSYFLDSAHENGKNGVKPEKKRRIKWSWKWFGLIFIALWVSAFIAGFTVLTYYVFVPAANRRNYFNEIERAYQNYFDLGYYSIVEKVVSDGDEKENERYEGYIDGQGAPVFYSGDNKRTVKDGVLTYENSEYKYVYIQEPVCATVEELALYNIFPDDDDLGLLTEDDGDFISYIRKVKGGYYLEMKDNYFTDELSGAQKKNIKLTDKIKGKIEVTDGKISYMEVTVKYLNKPDNEHFTLQASFEFIAQKPEIEHKNLQERKWNGTIVGNNYYPPDSPDNPAPDSDPTPRCEELLSADEFASRLSGGKAKKLATDYKLNRALTENAVFDGGDCFWYSDGATVKVYNKSNLSAPRTVNLALDTIENVKEIHVYNGNVYFVGISGSYTYLYSVDVNSQTATRLFSIYGVSAVDNVSFNGAYMLYYGYPPDDSGWGSAYRVYNLKERKLKCSYPTDLTVTYMDSSGNIYGEEKIDNKFVPRYYSGKSGITLKGESFFYCTDAIYPKLAVDGDSVYVADGDYNFSEVNVYRYERGVLKETLSSKDKRFVGNYRKLSNGYCHVALSYTSSAIYDENGKEREFGTFKYKDGEGNLKTCYTLSFEIVEAFGDVICAYEKYSYSEESCIYVFDAKDLSKPLYYTLSTPYKSYSSDFRQILIVKAGATTFIAVRTDSENTYAYDVYCF